ncbi:hypothetical protein D9M72_473730 [compost metagenome]
MRQRRQRIDELLRRYALHRGKVGVGQWHARGQRLGQQQVAAIAAHRRGAVQREPGQQLRDLGRRMAGADFGDIARLPVERIGVPRCQHQVERRRALAAGVQVAAPGQHPVAVARTLPVGNLGAAAERGQVVLPVAQRASIAVVDLDQVEQRLRAMALQPVVKRVAEGAKARVAAVAQRQDAVAQLAQPVRAASQQTARKPRRAVGRVALAGGADHEQRLPAGGQPAGIDLGQRQQLHRHAGALQRGRGLQRQLLGKPGLAGIGDQRGAVRGTCQCRHARAPLAVVRQHRAAEAGIGGDHAGGDGAARWAQQRQRHAAGQRQPAGAGKG